MDKDSFEIPKEWYCPITQQIMKDPVIAADGFTYERTAIQNWFARSNHSPLTGLPLANTTLIFNRALKRTIQQLEENQLNQQKKLIINNALLPQNKKILGLVKYELPDINISLDQVIDGQQVYIKCQIIPPPKPNNKRNPCSIICILDVSESMDTDSVMGGKDVESHGFSRLDLVKHSINTMIQFMQDTDEIALVPFSTSAKIALPLIRTTNQGKEQVKNATKNLQTIGTTNIWDGFKVSIQILKQLNKRQKDHNVFVVLLTDGQPNLNPPRGIVPTLIKFLQLQKLPRPNIHVFGYGYQLDTNLLTQIAQVGHGTYTYIPDCSMVGTAFVNFMAAALSTITNDVRLQLQNLNPLCQLKQAVGYNKSEKWIFNIGALQYGQSRQIVFKLPQRVLDKLTQIQNGKVGDVVIYYSQQQKTIKKQIILAKQTNQSESMKKSILRSKYLILLNKLMKQKKTNITKCFKQIDEFFQYASLLNEKQQSQFTRILLKQLKNPANDNEGQVSKAFQKQEWFEKWGKHYIPSLFRAHLMQVCTNFKDPALQLYGGQLFEENRSIMDTIFIKMPPPQPTAKKVAKLVYKPAPVDMSDYYNYGGGCIHENCLVLMEDGSQKQIRHLKKGDKVKGGIIKCIVKTNVFDWIQMIRIGSLLITPWHPIKINGRWVFPIQYTGSKSQNIFVESYYNFVMQQKQTPLVCEGVQCIGLGHGIMDNVVTAHQYFAHKILDDLQRYREWQQGQILLQKLIRNPETHQVMGIQVEDI